MGKFRSLVFFEVSNKLINEEKWWNEKYFCSGTFLKSTSRLLKFLSIKSFLDESFYFICKDMEGLYHQLVMFQSKYLKK